MLFRSPCRHWAPDAHDDREDGGAAGLQVDEEAGVRTAPPSPSHTCAAGGRWLLAACLPAVALDLPLGGATVAAGAGGGLSASVESVAWSRRDSPSRPLEVQRVGRQDTDWGRVYSDGDKRLGGLGFEST